MYENTGEAIKKRLKKENTYLISRSKYKMLISFKVNSVKMSCFFTYPNLFKAQEELK